MLRPAADAAGRAGSTQAGQALLASAQRVAGMWDGSKDRDPASALTAARLHTGLMAAARAASRPDVVSTRTASVGGAACVPPPLPSAAQPPRAPHSDSALTRACTPNTRARSRQTQAASHYESVCTRLEPSVLHKHWKLSYHAALAALEAGRHKQADA
jgi:hypothetical protein